MNVCIQRKQTKGTRKIYTNVSTYTYTHVYIYIYIYIYISLSSSCRATSTDIPEPLSPPLPIIHRFWQVFRATVCIFELVVLLLLGHMRGSIGVHH